MSERRSSCVRERGVYRDAVPGAVGPVRPGEGDVIRDPAPGEEGAGEPDVRAHQGVALPAGVDSYGLGLLRRCGGGTQKSDPFIQTVCICITLRSIIQTHVIRIYCQLANKRASAEPVCKTLVQDVH